MNLDRRSLLKSTFSVAGLATVSGVAFGQSGFTNPLVSYQSLKTLGPLGDPNELGLRLPLGILSRLIATSGERVPLAHGGLSSYRWHQYPDGGACFATDDGGWIYTSNAETYFSGGAGAIRFNSLGEVIDAYSILSGTRQNCSGGVTPWGTWLSCEEVSKGAVFECNIYSQNATKIPALGYFKHEAIAIDVDEHVAYLTEDETDGLLYRFVPDDVENGRMDLTSGELSAAVVSENGYVSWVPIPNPTPNVFERSTRQQVNASTFNGGEGIWYHEGHIYFTTKGDDRVWIYDTQSSQLARFYDRGTSSNPILSGVDAITVSEDGHVLVAEDGGDMQVVILGPYGDIYPLVQVVGQDSSEITGISFNPSGDRFYFSSQRGGRDGDGLTYELSGEFGS